MWGTPPSTDLSRGCKVQSGGHYSEGEEGAESGLICQVTSLSSTPGVSGSQSWEGQQQLWAFYLINREQLLGEFPWGMQSRQSLNG